MNSTPSQMSIVASTLRERCAARGIVDQDYFREVVLSTDPAPHEDEVDCLWRFVRGEASIDELVDERIIRLIRGEIFLWLYGDKVICDGTVQYTSTMVLS